MIAALALALAQAEEPAPVLAERAPVAGMQAVMSVSTLIYEGYADRPHELLAIYVFPDRAFWRRSLTGGSAHDRQLEYRSGDACWRMEPAENTSRRLTSAERDEQTLRMELRRALLLWPDGFPWERPEGAAPRAELGALGRLEAALGPDGHPERLTSFDAGGHAREAFEGITWSTSAERPLPASARLSAGGQLIWRETFTEVATRARFLDHLFVPPDRRGPLPVEVRKSLAPLRLEIAERTVLRTPLDPALDLPAALARASAVRSEAQRALPGSDLAPGLELELSPGGRPQAVVLTLAAPLETPGDPPPGSARAPAESVLAVDLEAFPPPESGGLGALLEALRRDPPPTRRTGTARLWCDPEAPAPKRRLRVLLPLN